MKTSTFGMPPSAGRRQRIGLMMAVVLAVLGQASTAWAAQVTATWKGPGGTGGAGNWNVPANWDIGVVPNNGTPAGTTYKVLIDGAKTGAASSVSLDIGATIDSLTIDAGDSLGINDARTLTIALAGTLSNAGTLSLNSTGNLTDLKISGDVSLSGGGTVTLSNNGNNRIYGVNGTERLTNVNNTISGAGQIGVNLMALTNQATINVTASAGLTIDPNGTGVINTGTIRASGGNTLNLNAAPYNNAGGLIRASASIVQFNSGANVTGGTEDVVGAGELKLNGGSIKGGTLTNSSTGIIRALTSSTSTIGGVVSNPAGGQIILNDASALLLTGGAGNSYSNAGSITLNSTSNLTDLRLDSGDVSLTGGGTMTLSNNGNNRIYGVNGTERLTNVNNTISGAGQIGVNLMALTNQNVIDATTSAGLTIDPNGTGAINTGTIRASSGNTLNLNAAPYNNAGGLIQANASIVQFNSSVSVTGGTVDMVGAGELKLNGGSVKGGTLTNSSTGIIRALTSSTSTIGGTVSNPVGGQIILEDASTLLLTGGAGNSYSNAGSIALNSTGNLTDLKLDSGDVSLTGGGAVTLSNFANNRIYGIAGTERLTNANNTISGAGQIGVNLMALTNQSVIDATTSAGLTIDPNGTGVINTGTIRASSGNTLNLNAAPYNNAGGLIRASASIVQFNSGANVTGGTEDVVGAGQLRFAGGVVTGGTITNSSSGIIRTLTSTASTLGGAVTNPVGGQIILEDASTLLLTGGAGNSYSNAGSIALSSAGNLTDLRISGDVSLTGGGTVTLSNNGNNRIFGLVGTERLTNVNNTISGAGQIGVNLMALTNQSVIDVTASAGLTLDPNGTGAINTGTIRASGGNTLTFNGAPYNNAGGLIRANAGIVQFNSSANVTGGTVDVVGAGQLRFANGVVTGGTITNSSTGIIRSVTSTASTLGGAVTNPAGGQIILEDASTLLLAGGAGNSYSNAGSIALNSAGNLTDLRINGDVSLSGGGTVTLSNNGNNRIYGFNGTERLTNVNNTISGAGQIGVNFMALTNQSVIDVTASAGLTLDPNGTGAINTGTIRASGGNTLTFNGAPYNNAGGLIRANVSIVRFDSGANVTGGTVDVVGAGQLRFTGGVVTGGTITNSSTGIIRSVTSTASTLGGAVTNPAGGQIILEDASTLLFVGGAGNSYSNAGSIALNSVGNLTDLRINGDISLTGGGTVTLSNNGNNRIFGIAGTERLTNVNNTISGAGQIGANFMALTNQATILSNQTNPLSIDHNGAGSFLNSGTVQVNAGSTLALGGGDNLTQTAGSTLINGTLTTSGSGAVVVQGGTLNGIGTVSGNVTNAGGTVGVVAAPDTFTISVLTQTSGTTILNGGNLACATANINGGTLSGVGTLTGNLNVANGGIVSPGSSPGILTVTGNYNQSASGVLNIEIRGLTPGTQFDRLAVGGVATLAGTLNVTLLNGFVPAINNNFKIMTWASQSGSFAPTNFPDLGDNGFIANYNPVDLTLIVKPLSISVKDVTVTEGNSGTVDAVFNVKLLFASAKTVTVHYATANGTATAPADYTAASGTVSFAPGETSKPITVPVKGDLLDEANEIFTVNLSAPVNAIVLDGVGQATIKDDDATPILSINDVALAEGNSGTVNFNFNINLGAPSGRTVTVTYKTNDGSATAGSDYTAHPQTTLTYTPGQTSKIVTVVVKGDLLNEAPETFKVVLQSATFAAIVDDKGAGTILNDDALPALSIGDATVTEGDSGSKNALFTVTMNAAAGRSVTVHYTTADGTATQPADYANTSGTITFSPGQTSKTLPVAVLGDTLSEANETFKVNLSSPDFATLADSQGVATITDNETQPTLAINDVSQAEGNSGTTNFSFTVTLSKVSGQNVTVAFTAVDGTALKPGDYAGTSGTLTFAPGTTTKNITIAVKGDTTVEPNETFFVHLSSPSGATFLDAQGTGTISNDDS